MKSSSSLKSGLAWMEAEFRVMIISDTVKKTEGEGGSEKGTVREHPSPGSMRFSIQRISNPSFEAKKRVQSEKKIRSSGD
jgi:hypothetical protein